MFRLVVSAVSASLAAWYVQAPASLPLDQIGLVPGCSNGLYATGVDNARELSLGAKGTLFVGSRGTRKVYAVIDRDRCSQRPRR